MKIGVTGHQRLDSPAKWGPVELRVNQFLSGAPTPLVGITSLAIGADQLFANAVIRHKGTIEVIIPFNGYELTFDEGPDRCEYLRLIEQAARIEVLSNQGSNEQAYFAAGRRVVDCADMVLAIWDGKPAQGLGGTADIVWYAETLGKSVKIICPNE